MSTFLAIVQFVASETWGILPVFLFSILLSVLLNELRLDQLIQRALSTKVGLAVPLATAVGSFTPFCSCTVIPVITGLLASGVPLAAVMAFWISSPTMDLEIFALSVNILGWQLAVARLLATLTLSLSAGFLTYFLVRQGFMRGQPILRKLPVASNASCCAPEVAAPVVVAAPAATNLLLPVRGKRSLMVLDSPAPTAAAPALIAANTCCVDTSPVLPLVAQEASCCETGLSAAVVALPVSTNACCSATTAVVSLQAPSSQERWWAPIISSARTLQWQRVGQQMFTQSWKLGRWLLLAFLLEALLDQFVPSAVITGIFGATNPFSIPLAALIGIPVYVNTVSAWPIMAGLLAHGMRPGAAIAFLIAGPITTFPAMVAVANVVRWRVFALYFSMGVLGAIALGYLTSLVLR